MLHSAWVIFGVLCCFLVGGWSGPVFILRHLGCSILVLLCILVVLGCSSGFVEVASCSLSGGVGFWCSLF